MYLNLSATFNEAASLKPIGNRPTIVSVAGAGNWKTLYPAIQAEMPKVRFNSGKRAPVLVGTKTTIYLSEPGDRGADQFHEGVRRLLRHGDRIFVFDAQLIECVSLKPSCVHGLLGPGNTAALFFRGKPSSGFSSYFKSQSHLLRYLPMTVKADCIAVAATTVSAEVICEQFDLVFKRLNNEERVVFSTMRTEFLQRLAPELEDHFLEGCSGLPKLRDLARRRMASALLRATVPTYSVKSGVDPIKFFGQVLLDKFELHGLPAVDVSEVSPNLAYVLKTRKRFAELTELRNSVSGPH